MSETTAEFITESPASSTSDETTFKDPAFQAFEVLRIGFTVAPIVAGADKFFHFLVDWTTYLPPVVGNFLGGNAAAVMMAVGVIEIIAGIGVFLKPRVFGYVVAGWLVSIIANLLLIPGYFDIALRDLGLAIAAFALARLSAVYDA